MNISVCTFLLLKRKHITLKNYLIMFQCISCQGKYISDENIVPELEGIWVKNLDKLQFTGF